MNGSLGFSARSFSLASIFASMWGRSAFAADTTAPLVRNDTDTMASTVDPFVLPDAPAPPSLPDLTHRALLLSLETTIGSIRPEPGSSRRVAWLERFEAEYALALRRWYIGFSHQSGAGPHSPLGQGGLALGYPEFWGRAVWASPIGLTYGGGLGVVLPLITSPAALDDNKEDHTVSVLRPVDDAVFVRDNLSIRPFVDVRSIDGPVLLQLRQGLDWSRAGSRIRMTSRTIFYIGYRATDWIGLGLEASEAYFVRADVSDDRRAAYTITPGFRIMTKLIQPAFSFVIPVERPLLGLVDSYWAVRLNFEILMDGER